MNKRLYGVIFLLPAISFFSLQSMEENRNDDIHTGIFKEHDSTLVSKFYGSTDQEHILNLLKSTMKPCEAEIAIEKYFKEKEHLATSNDFKIAPYELFSAACSPLYYLVVNKSLLALGNKLMEQGAQPSDELEAGIILGNYVRNDYSFKDKGVLSLLEKHKDLISEKCLTCMGKTMNLLTIAKKYQNNKAIIAMIRLLKQ